MKPTFKTTLALTTAALSFLATHSAQAQAVDSGTYTQNFDSMGTSGTTAPTGWSVVSEAGSHDTFSPLANPNGTGVSPNLTAGALTAEPTLTAGAATTQKGLIGYNFGTTATSTDRALGTSPSGNAATILELSLTNSTGSAINALSLSYDIDRFTTTTANNTAYNSGPTVGVEENPGYQLFYSLNNGTTWTNVSSLNPTLSGPGGVIVPNTVGVTNVSDPLLTLGGTWAAGGNLQLAWLDDNAQSPSPDQLLGLNNVSIATAAVPEPSSIACGLVAALLFAGLVARRRHPAHTR
jgi:hypothetical protein